MIRLLLIVHRMTGKMWTVLSVDSCVCEGCKLFIRLLISPLCVDNYVHESRVVIRMFVPVIIMEVFDQDNNEIVIFTSPTTFIAGGMSMSAKCAMIHHISTGVNTRPRAMTIV